eukprot:768153-Hanusia_phi.AAC.3
MMRPYSGEGRPTRGEQLTASSVSSCQAPGAVVNNLRAPPSIGSTARSHHNDPVVIASQVTPSPLVVSHPPVPPRPLLPSLIPAFIVLVSH